MKQTIYTLLAMLVASVSMPAAADDYLPLVREGVRWHHVFVHSEECPENPPEFTPNTYTFNYFYELRGDTVVNGKTYKKCFMVVDDEEKASQTAQMGWLPWEGNGTPIAMMREESRCVFVIYNNPVPLFQESDEGEYVLYDFNAWDNAVKEGKATVGTTYVGDNLCKVYTDDYGVFGYDAIESVGSVSYFGTLLSPFYPSSTACFYTMTSMTHVTDTADKILYKTTSYDDLFSGVDDVKVAEVKGDDRYYNLQGQAVDIKTAPAGIYIHNGKKVTIQ